MKSFLPLQGFETTETGVDREWVPALWFLPEMPFGLWSFSDLISIICCTVFFVEASLPHP